MKNLPMKETIDLDGFTGKFYETRNKEDQQNQNSFFKKTNELYMKSSKTEQEQRRKIIKLKI